MQSTKVLVIDAKEMKTIQINSLCNYDMLKRRYYKNKKNKILNQIAKIDRSQSLSEPNFRDVTIGKCQ